MLIVEDETDICDSLQHFFASRGFSVQSVFSGEEAIEQLRQHSADVILLDLVLPGLSGIEVLKRAKQLYPNANVVIVSALDQNDVRETATRYGASAYITKPFDFSDATWRPVFS